MILALRGEPDKLISKPDTYAELLQLARKPKIFFHQLRWFKDKDITFRFNWKGVEVDLDDSAFEFVHAEARLRIITPGSTSSVKSEHKSKSPEPFATSEPLAKRVKIEDQASGKGQDVVDLTESDAAPDLCSRDTTAAHDMLAVEEQIPGSASQTGTAPQTASQRQPAQSKVTSQELQPGLPEAVPVSKLTAHNFAVNMGSRTRTVRPHRQLIPRQWVNCREPWPGDQQAPDPQVGTFFVNVVTG